MPRDVIYAFPAIRLIRNQLGIDVPDVICPVSAVVQGDGAQTEFLISEGSTCYARRIE